MVVHSVSIGDSRTWYSRCLGSSRLLDASSTLSVLRSCGTSCAARPSSTGSSPIRPSRNAVCGAASGPP
ncbi:MAG: hypothetical protein E6J91_19185 [Deltaproteobacteria bacterium]|nr:MAG: hypothetical protein E6J91_19185 [Deltaproteobacteria bacterium]